MLPIVPLLTPNCWNHHFDLHSSRFRTGLRLTVIFAFLIVLSLLRFNRQQEKNHTLKWSLPDAYAVSYATAITAALRAHNLIDTNGDGVGTEASLSNSLEVVCVGGVYLQLYVSQAAGRWMLRQPEAFLEALMNRILETFNRKSSGTDPGLLRLLSRAALQLLADRPGLLDGLPKKGFAHRILDLCPTVNEPEEARTCALLMHAMSSSKVRQFENAVFFFLRNLKPI